MSTFKNLPAHWDRMELSARAEFLVRTGQAADYRAACSILAHRRRPRGRPVKAAPVKKDFWWQE